MDISPAAARLKGALRAMVREDVAYKTISVTTHPITRYTSSISEEYTPKIS
jgi:hypothetical protein